MKRPYAIALAVAGSCLAVFWLWGFLSRPSNDRLAAGALTAAALKDRMHAAVTLSMIKAPDPTPQLLRLLKESKDPEVIAQAFNALAFRLNSDALPEFVSALNHEAAKVRHAAYAGVLRFHGGALPQGIEYNPDAPAEERAGIVRQLQEISDKKSPEFDLFAAAPTKTIVPPTTKEPITKEPATKENTTKEPATKETTLPAPSPSTAPPPAYPPAPFTPVEYPAITLLVGMLQIIAILVLIFDVAGAVSLIVGERRTGKQLPKASTHAAPPAAPLEKNSAALWIKIALLVAGAVCMIALLTAAEMVRLAVRMEQKMDYMSRTR